MARVGKQRKTEAAVMWNQTRPVLLSAVFISLKTNVLPTETFFGGISGIFLTLLVLKILFLTLLTCYEHVVYLEEAVETVAVSNR